MYENFLENANIRIISPLYSCHDRIRIFTAVFEYFWSLMFVIAWKIKVHQQFLERPFLERPSLERPSLERPSLEWTIPRILKLAVLRNG
jgi:hypothetical protein